MQWLNTEVISRLPDDGLMMVLGTRIAPQDLYRKLREMLDYDEVTPLWTYLAQPAVLDGSGSRPRNGMCCGRRAGRGPRWPAVRRCWVRLPGGLWSTSSRTCRRKPSFPAGAVEASVNRARAAGALTGGLQGRHLDVPGSPLHRGRAGPGDDGQDGDDRRGLGQGHPASAYVLDGFNKANCPPALMRRADGFVHHAVQASRSGSSSGMRSNGSDTRRELKRELFGLGCILREHWTGANKYDEDFGVMSLAPLFLSCVDPVEGDAWRRREGGGLIDLPNRQFSTFVDELVEQLIVWMPGQNKRTVLSDLVMALWFCEIACKRFWIGTVRRRGTRITRSCRAARRRSGVWSSLSEATRGGDCRPPGRLGAYESMKESAGGGKYMCAP
jgi:hypothetical protein